MAASQPFGSQRDGLPFEIVRPMESASGSLFLARLAPKGGGKQQLFVIEQYAGVATSTDRVQFVREATRISSLIHANLPRIREVRTRGDDLVVVRSYVDGARLSAVWPNGEDGSSKLPLEAALRIIVDVLGALGALHNLSDDKQPPLRIVHGEVSPTNILMGFDGAARLLHAIGRRAPGVRLTSEALRYVAPELLTEGTADRRADVYSIGALLWEALSGKPLTLETDGIAIIEAARAGHPAATVPEGAPWASPLIPVVARALEPDPQDRFESAMALGSEIRRVAGVKLATIPATGAHVRAAVGDRDPLHGAVPKVEAPVAPRAASPELADHLPGPPGPPPAPAPPQPPAPPLARTAATTIVATPPPGLMRALAPPFPQKPTAPPPPVPSQAARAPAPAVELDDHDVDLAPPSSNEPPSLRTLASVTPTLHPADPAPQAERASLDVLLDNPPKPKLEIVTDTPSQSELVAAPLAVLHPVTAVTPEQVEPPAPPAPMPLDLPAMPGVMIGPEPKGGVQLPPPRSRMVTMPSIRVRRTRRVRLVKLGGIAAFGLLALGVVGTWALSPESSMFRAFGQTAPTEEVAPVKPPVVAAPPPAEPPVTTEPPAAAAPPVTPAPPPTAPRETPAPVESAPAVASSPPQIAVTPAPPPKPPAPKPAPAAKPKPLPAAPAQRPEAVFHPSGL